MLNESSKWQCDVLRRSHFCPKPDLLTFVAVVVMCYAPAVSLAQPQPGNAHRLAHAHSATSPSCNVLGLLFGEQFLADNVARERVRAAAKPAEDRFEYLRKWVLPSELHSSFRMNGMFTQTYPAGVAADEQHNQSANGGELVSPVFDLLDVAKELDRLEELRMQIADIRILQETSDYKHRAKAALLALIYLELTENQAAETELGKLLSLVRRSRPGSLHDQWPETLVAYQGVHRFVEHEAVGDLLTFLYLQRTMRWIPRGIESWHTHIASLMGRYRYNMGDESHGPFEAAFDPDEWIPVTRVSARSRGSGYAHARWHFNKRNELYHAAGHLDEALLYRQPLRGNFEVECDIAAHGLAQGIAAGTFSGAYYDRKKLEIGTFRRATIERRPIDPAFAVFEPWMRYRAVFRDGSCSVFLNGRLVRKVQLADDYDPWIGLRSWWRNNARIRDFRITGSPEVCESVAMVASDSLDGWSAYYGESVGQRSSQWSSNRAPLSGERQITGRLWPSLRGSYIERLLQYHRPLVEDGTIEYDFFYEPGHTNVHPAFDRLAFLVEPNGIQLHTITDGKYDRTGLSPDNMVSTPGIRRDSKIVPLKLRQWNRMTLSIASDTVTLKLNDAMVHTHKLDRFNNRTFGLFHFADQTQVHVRNIIMRGAWPTSIPSVHEQRWADHTVALLDAKLGTLKASRFHDFADDGLPAEYFDVPQADKVKSVTLTDNGVLHSQESSGSWANSDVTPRFTLHGDFDVTVRFDDLQVTDQDYCGCGITVVCNDGFQVMLNRRQQGSIYERVAVAFEIPQGDQEFRSTYETVGTELNAGRLRIARHDDTYYALFAEHDSSVFRLIGKRTIKDSGAQSAQVRLRVIANDSGKSSVTWNDVAIRSSKLIHHSSDGEESEVVNDRAQDRLGS